MAIWNPRANSVFLGALEQPDGDERQAFVDQACGQDAELRAQVLGLLLASDQAGSFLESAIVANGSNADDAFEQPGDWVGPYKLLQQIGAGGMGVVFMAEQAQPVRRMVALKIVKPGVDTRQVVARFEAERQALAIMDHPNIAKVLDAGATEAGRPFFVMELVKGLPITEFCDERNLPIRERLRLLIPVCQAVQHAHQKGIIHRDLKPSNVMIGLYDGVSVPKIIDFGVAKATGPKLTDRTLFTEYGALLGTLEYMSPEQAELNQIDVDTRSDIYSLGVLLYELLTGTTPLERSRIKKSSILDALRTIREEEPIKPSTRIAASAALPAVAASRGTLPTKLRSVVRGELDWIVMKALDKDRDRRYQTAGDLLRDIECYLGGLPVHARQTGRVSRVWRWCQRNPYVSTLLAIVALLLVFIAVGASFSAIRLQRESGAARAAEHNALVAEKSRRQELVTVYLSELRSLPVSGAPRMREAGVAAVRSALAAVPWNELTDRQRSELVNATIPCLVSSELTEESRRRLGFTHHQNPYPEFDIDSKFELLAMPAGFQKPAVIHGLNAARDERQLAVSPRLEASARRKFSPDGEWLLEAYPLTPTGPRIIVWDVPKGRISLDRSTLGSQTEMLSGEELPSFHPDQRHVLVLGPGNRSFHKLNIQSGEQVAASPPRFRVSRTAYSADGKYLSIASLHLVAEVVDPEKWSTVATFPQFGRAASTVWHPTEPHVIFGTFEGELYRWRPALPGKTELLGSEHAGIIDMLAFSPDGRLLASSDDEKQFTIRRLEDNLVLARGSGCALRFSTDSERIAVVAHDELIIYRLRESPVYRRLRETADAAQFSSDGRWLAVSGLRGVRLFYADSLQFAADLGLDECGPAAFHPSGKQLATFGYFSHTWCWQVANNAIGPPKAVVPGAFSSFRLAPQHQGRYASWSGDGRLLALADFRDDKIILWDESTGAAREFLSFRKPVQVELSPDGKWLAAQSWSDSRTVVWNIVDKREVLNVPGHMGMSFSDDGRWFANRGISTIELYDVPSGKILRQLPLESVIEQQRLPPVFQPGGKLLAASDLSARVQLFDRETGAAVATLDDRDTDAITWLSFSADGRRLAVTRPERVAVWDLSELTKELVATGLPIARFARERDGSLEIGARATSSVQVDRGPLPPAGGWHRMWQLLARYEAMERNWPDAISNMNRGWLQIPDSPKEKAAFLAERGKYLARNLSFQAAADDWQAALRLVPDEATAALELGRLYVLGPEGLRDPRRAIALASILSLSSEHRPIGQLLRAMALAQLGQSTTDDTELLASAAASAMDGVPGEWRIAAGYFATVANVKAGLQKESSDAFDAAVTLHERYRRSLTPDRALQLEELRSTVQEALSPAPAGQ